MKIATLLLCVCLVAGVCAQEQVSLVEYQKALAMIDELRAEIAELKRSQGEVGGEAVPLKNAAPATVITPAPQLQAAQVEQPLLMYSAAQEAELTRLSDAEEAELNPQSRFDDAWLVGKHRIQVKRPLVSGDGNLVIKVRDTRAGGVGAGTCSILLVSNGDAQLKRYAVRDKKQFSFGGHYYRFSVEGAESNACLLSVQRRS